MKKIITIILAGFIVPLQLYCQANLKDLAIPNSPAFVLVDEAPTNVESPLIPREFVLGLAQNFDIESRWFQNYSMDFTPYWWVTAQSRDFYSFAGFDGPTDTTYNPFSGLKFTGISIGILQKDLIPDKIELTQKVFSVGARTTLITIRQKSYVKEIRQAAQSWHDAVQEVSNDCFFDPNCEDKVSGKHVKKVSEILRQKPIFQWNLAAGYAVYGINDSAWQTGRYGAWTNAAVFVPVGKEERYLDIFATGRYMYDAYTLKETGAIGTSGAFDVGGKLQLDLNRFSLGGEAIFRMASEGAGTQQRISAYASYKLYDSLFIQAAYGEDFGPETNVFSLFGINWGFGQEKVEAPK